MTCWAWPCAYVDSGPGRRIGWTCLDDDHLDVSFEVYVGIHHCVQWSDSVLGPWCVVRLVVI